GNPGGSVPTRGIVVFGNNSEIDRNVFSHGTAVDNIVIETGATRNRVGKNYNRQGTVKIVDAGTNSVFEEFVGYTGSLDNITTYERSPVQTHVLAAGATGTPPSLGTIAGAIVETYSA